MEGAPDHESSRDECLARGRFPCLRLFRVPGAAADPKRLILAAIGLVLLQAGWDGLDRIQHGAEASALSSLRSWEWTAVDPTQPEEVFWRLSEPIRLLTAPFRLILATTNHPFEFLRLALAAAWTVAVWGVIGGAIARIAVVDAARHERISLRESLGFAIGKAVPLIGTPLLPLVGVSLLATLLAGFGLIYRLPGGPIIGGALAFLPMLGGLLITLILLGLAAGWPLMPAAVAAEGEDGFDAMSRAFAYVFQRPWVYAGYALMAAMIAGVGLIFFQTFAGMVVHFTSWGLGFGGPSVTVATLFGEGRAIVPPAAAATHGFWLGVVGLLLRAWIQSAFFTAASVIYLLLRRDVDGKPIAAIAYKSPVSPLLQAAAEAAMRHAAAPPRSGASPKLDLESISATPQPVAESNVVEGG